MIYLVNQKLMTTVAMVSVIQIGMKISCTFLEKSEGKKVRAANPTIMIVTAISRRDEDFFAPPLP
jgi:hypothetical protein